jgi:hypothetical protein
MKKRIFNLLGLFFVFVSLNLFAQPEGPGEPPGGEPPCWPPQDCIPADNGIIWMIAAGLLLAVYKIYQIRKNNEAMQ